MRTFLFFASVAGALMVSACSSGNPLALTGPSSQMDTTAHVDIVPITATDDPASAEPEPAPALVVSSPASSEPSAARPVVKRKQSIDKCPNLRGDQRKVPNGYVLKHGRCAKVVSKPAPPREDPNNYIGVCGPELPGWDRVPPGYALINGKCVYVSHL